MSAKTLRQLATFYEVELRCAFVALLYDTESWTAQYHALSTIEKYDLTHPTVMRSVRREHIITILNAAFHEVYLDQDVSVMRKTWDITLGNF